MTRDFMTILLGPFCVYFACSPHVHLFKVKMQNLKNNSKNIECKNTLDMIYPLAHGPCLSLGQLLKDQALSLQSSASGRIPGDCFELVTRKFT